MQSLYASTAVRAITYPGGMPRWEPNAPERLHDAALALFVEQGYEQTTVAQIAERAGLTERTFFNHFANKREVLFGKTSEAQKDIVAREIVAAPDDMTPTGAMVHGLQIAASEVLEGFRTPAGPRRDVIDRTPELQEREQGKRAALAAAISEALIGRGVEHEMSAMVAGVGLVVQQAAEGRWVHPEETRPLSELIPEAFNRLRAITNDAAEERS